MNANTSAAKTAVLDLIVRSCFRFDPKLFLLGSPCRPIQYAVDWPPSLPARRRLRKPKSQPRVCTEPDPVCH
jgi:hypothetical protein